MRETGVSLILGSLIKKITVALCVVPLMAAMALGPSSANADLTKAENFYKHTDFASSLALLNRQSSDAATNFLIGRNYFMMGEFKKSIEFLLKAACLRQARGNFQPSSCPGLSLEGAAGI
jgi:hypothetical protein